MLMIYLQMLETEEDKDKFLEIYHTYRELMTSVAMKILKNEHDTQDAVHQAFEAIIMNIQKFHKRPCPEFKAYIVIIVRNKAIDIIRERERIVGTDYIDNLEWEDDIDIDIIDVHEAMTRLPEEQRTILMLHYYWGLRTRELADLYKVSQATIQKRIWRARKELQELLDGDGT